MNLIDFIILVIVIVTLGLIAYNNFIKKDRDECSKCTYRRDNCICGKKKWINLQILTYNKNDVIITSASKSKDVMKVCTKRYVVAYLFFFS